MDRKYQKQINEQKRKIAIRKRKNRERMVQRTADSFGVPKDKLEPCLNKYGDAYDPDRVGRALHNLSSQRDNVLMRNHTLYNGHKAIRDIRNSNRFRKQTTLKRK